MTLDTPPPRTDPADGGLGEGQVAVWVRGLHKAYHMDASARRAARAMQGKALPTRVPALEDLDLTVRAGEVYGILGPNGAGKTTLMKVLATILLPDEGTVEVLGHDLVDAPGKVRGRIGIVLGEYERTFHWRLTGRQNLAFFADFYQLPRAQVDTRIQDVLEAVGLTDAADTRYDAYSTGMKHRLALARGLLPNPDLLLLDEPTAGLDAQSSAQVAQAVRDAAARGTAIIYTTHRLQEAGLLCDRILVLDRGRQVAEATPDELAALTKGRQVVEARGKGPWTKELVTAVTELGGVHDWETRGPRLLFYTEPDDDIIQRVTQALRQHAGHDVAITVRPPDVEDAFHALTNNKPDAPEAAT